jgi:hypothetical protein
MKIYDVSYTIKNSVWSPGKVFHYTVAANNEEEVRQLHADTLFGSCTDLSQITDTGKEHNCDQIGYLV